MSKQFGLTVAISLALSACAVGPNYQPPVAALPDRWQAVEAATMSEGGAQFVTEPGAQHWWSDFQDPTLDQLVMRTLEANLDLRMAVLRRDQSRLRRDVVAGARLPSVNGEASYQRQRQSEVGTGARLINVIGPPGNRDNIIDALSEPYDVYQAGFDTAWEIDLWGRVHRSLESADASVRIGEEDLHALQVSLIADVTRTYFELRGVQDQLTIAQRDIDAARSTLELAEYRAKGGLTSQLDAVSQRARLADAQSRIPALEQRALQLTEQLALLVGANPGSLKEQLQASKASAPRVPERVALGVPSELARRRPDIRRAEAQLHAATAEIGIATADLYPRISLTGNFVWQSLDASDLSDWGARQWSIGPSLSLPIFDGGRRRATVELRKLQQQEAAIGYQRTVLRAWHEIEIAISGIRAEERRNRELAAEVAASREAHELATLRYKRGLTDFLVALDAQRTLLQAERALSESSTALTTQVVGLYEALGAG